MNEAALTGAGKTANSLASLGDRALFILALLVLGAVGYRIVKHLMKQVEFQAATHAASAKETQTQLADLYKEANAGRVKVAEALTVCGENQRENTEILRQVAGLLERHRDLDRNDRRKQS